MSSEAASKKRKFDLTKCERCRIDKQKCLPIDRSWPTKCTRCIDKHFPCSEGRRIQRKTKHAKSASPAPPPSSFADGFALRSGDEKKITQWMFLLSYHKILSIAMGRLWKLNKDTTAPFVDMWLEKIELKQHLIGTMYHRFQSFSEEIDSILFRLTNELLGSRLPTLYFNDDLFSALLGHVLTWFPKKVLCPVCNPAEDYLILQGFRQRGHSGSELLARLGRVTKHVHDRDHWDFDAIDLLEAEMAHISELASMVQSTAAIVLQDLGLYGLMPPTLQNSLFVEPEDISYRLFWTEYSQSDCLGRTTLHQWLDGNHEFVDERDVELLKATLNLGNIYQVDVLNRSLLHVACQINWDAGVQQLLQSGANAGLPTIYGSLPLHYAAANGSLEVCRLLLDPRVMDYNVNALDFRHNSALYYAVASKNTELVKFLLTRPYNFDPNLCGWNRSPPPLIKAIYTDCEELVQLLLDHGADPRKEFYGHTAFYYAARRKHIGIMKLLGAKSDVSQDLEHPARSKALTKLQEWREDGVLTSFRRRADIEFPINKEN